MDTNELIGALVADKHRPAPLAAFWWAALAAATVVAAIVFFATIGPRPDIEEAARSGRFLLKFAVTLTLAASAFAVVRALSRPGDRRHALACMAAAPALLAAAVVFELLVLPRETWANAAMGTNALVCLTYIPLIGIGPLGLFILALRHGAPTRPALAGAAAGLVAGGLAATFYAAHCTDDSPLFVAVWYTISVAMLALVGAVAGNRFARW